MFSAVTGRVAGDRQDYMAIAILHNSIFSGVNVKVKRAMMQCDATVTSTSLFVPILTFLGEGNPNIGDLVTTASKCPFDTQLSSSPGVNLYYPATGDGINDSVLSGTPSGGLVWRQWGTRLRTYAEQQLSYDNNQLPALVDTYDFVLNPDQYLLFRADSVAIADNNPGLGWFMGLVWTEESTGSHTISGTVSIAGTPVVGATVVILVSGFSTMSDARVWEVLTTTTGGVWTSSAIPDGLYAYAYAQHDAGGGTLYSATGAPYIQ